MHLLNIAFDSKTLEKENLSWESLVTQGYITKDISIKFNTDTNKVDGSKQIK